MRRMVQYTSGSTCPDCGRDGYVDPLENNLEQPGDARLRVKCTACMVVWFPTVDEVQEGLYDRTVS